MVVDDTLERRQGKNITAKGRYRDAIRSTEKQVVTCYGLKWVCMMLLVKLPWTQRHWALPVMTVLAPSKQHNQAIGRMHRTVNDWTMLMVKVISRWLNRHWVLMGDGAFACVKLAWLCNQKNVSLISRLRLDAALYAFPITPPKPTLGRPRSKGQRLPSFKALTQDASQPWQEMTVAWYAGTQKVLKVLTGTSLWYTSGTVPLPIRWVLTLNPETQRIEAFFSTELEAKAQIIIERFVLRWNIEVTFEESRAHLGFETQRQWSHRAIARTTPMLMGLFSLTCLIAKELVKNNSLPIQHRAWYQKRGGATFSDVIAYVRRSIWAQKYFNGSGVEGEDIKIPALQAKEMLDQLCRVA